MNAERLHRILVETFNDLNDNKILSDLSQLNSNLKNQLTQPNNVSFQNNVASFQKKLYNSLESMSYNTFSPGYKQVLEEIKGADLLGQNLKKRIESIFLSNSITPAKAHHELSSLYSELNKFQSGINNSIAGFKNLGIGLEKLNPGECELGYLIPRTYVDNNLEELSEEISDLNFILNNISEVVYNERREFKVKTISSSDYSLYINMGIGACILFSGAVKAILEHYKTILEIKNLRAQLNETGIPQEATEQIDSYANAMMKDKIDEMAKEAINKHYKGSDDGRKNELENSLAISFNKLANRIDNGFKIEIRVESLNGKKEDGEEGQAQIDQISELKQVANSIEFIESGGGKILKLMEEQAQEV